MPGDIKSYLLDGVGLWADVRLVDTGESRPLLLLDRDGVLIEDSGYVGRAAAARLGFPKGDIPGVDVRCLKALYTSDNGKLDAQIANLETWIAQGVPAICCFPIEPTAIERVAAKAPTGA